MADSIFQRIGDYARGGAKKEPKPMPTDEPMPVQNKLTPPAGKDAGSARGRDIEKALKDAGG